MTDVADISLLLLLLPSHNVVTLLSQKKETEGNLDQDRERDQEKQLQEAPSLIKIDL